MKIHLIAIGGTGMGALAGLLKARGVDVRGSDVQLYPPMSDQLAAANIPIFQGFAPENLDWGPDLVVVGNVCKQDHVEVIAAQERGLELRSLPQVLGEELIAGHHSIVVAGTHGKTTTTSVVTHLLLCAGRDPGCLVGGVPLAMGAGWRLGGGEDFVVEGDEYGSAFFDKRSKFLHYRPNSAILTSVELDHVDIFSGIDAVRDTFKKFVRLIPEDGLLVVCAQSAEALAIADAEARCRVETYAVDYGDGVPEATWTVRNLRSVESGRSVFDLYRGSELFATLGTLLGGAHNAGNVTAAVAIAHGRGVAPDVIRRAVGSFAGVARRQEFRGLASGVFVLDDYAHHPTAVAETLQALRKRFAGRRLIALYEPRTATSRRKTFQREFVDAFSKADVVVVGPLYDTSKIPPQDRFDPNRLADDLQQRGTRARHIADPDQIVTFTADLVRPGDVVVMLSSGALFGEVQRRLLSALGDVVLPATPQHLEQVRALLRDLSLDWEDIGSDARQSFLVLENESGFVGCVGVEIFDEQAVLRSLAVKPEWRGNGYGWMLADAAISRARFRGARRLYLVTHNASDFFAAKHGFCAVDRDEISAEVAASTTFRGQRDDLVVMRLDL